MKRTSKRGQEKMIGSTLKKIREREGLTQADLSRLSGVSRSYLAGIETGDRTPRIEQLEKICLALKVPISAIFFIANGESDIDKYEILEELAPLLKKMKDLFGIEDSEISAVRPPKPDFALR